MKPNIVFEAPITSSSGYGIHAREVAQYLCTEFTDIDKIFIDKEWGGCQRVTNIDKSIKSILKQDIGHNIKEINLYIKMGLPNEFNRIGNFNIGITAVVESSKCSIDFINGCNNMDLIIVPSNFCKRTLETSSKEFSIDIVPNIVVIPQCVDFKTQDKQLDNISNYLDKIKENFCFLVNQTWNLSLPSNVDRKNTEQLLHLVLNNFQNKSVEEKPGLILKLHSKNYSISDFRLIEKKLKQFKDEYPNSCNIYLIHGELNNTEMNTLYNHDKVKALITMTHGEGFGRPILESLMNNKPVIVPNWSGYLDFVDESCMKIDGTLGYHGKLDNIFVDNGKWFNVDVDKYREAINNYFLNYKSIFPNGYSFKDKESYSYTKIAKLYKETIDTYILS